MKTARRISTAILLVLLADSSSDAALPVSGLTCTPIDCSSITLTWTNNDVYDSIEILVDGIIVASLSGTDTSYTGCCAGSMFEVIPTCLGVPAPGASCATSAPSVTALTCTRDCGAGTITASWTNPASFTSIEVYVDGVLDQTLPGSSISATISQTTGTIGIVTSCGGTGSPMATCSFGLTAIPNPGQLILDRDPGGLIDSATALAGAFTNLGESFVIASTLDELPCGVPGAGVIVWSLSGTFPDNSPLTFEVGSYLADQIMAGGGVYHEGNNTWSTDPITPFHDLDGIAGAANGDDTLIALSGVGLTAAIADTYAQDQLGDDSNDQLVLGPDSAGSGADPLWIEGGGLGYLVASYYVTDPGLGNVICQSFEIGGFVDFLDDIVGDYIFGIETPPCIRVGFFNAVQEPSGSVTLTWGVTSIANWRYLIITAIPPSGAIETIPLGPTAWQMPYPYHPTEEGMHTFRIRPDCNGVGFPGELETIIPLKVPFLRGDVNGDGLVNIADAVALLGKLFGGLPPLPCQKVADTNGDGSKDISDAIYLLGFFFGGGPILPEPFPDCGIDCDPSVPCESWNGCP